MNRFKTKAISIALLSVMGLGSVGCSSMTGGDYGTSPNVVKVSVKASRHSCYVGENVTFFTKTENVLGHKAELKWTSTGGKLTVDDNGRVARVMFDQPGVYSVSVNLSLDGVDRYHDTTVVEVAAVP